MDVDHDHATLWQHLGELRNALLRACAVIALAVVVCFVYYDTLLSWLVSPLENAVNSHALREERVEYVRLTNTSSISKTISAPASDIVSLQGGEQSAPDLFLVAPGGTLTYAKATSPHRLVLLGPLEGMLTALKASLWVGIAVSSPFWLWILMSFILPALRQQEKQLALSFLLTSCALASVGCLFAFFVTIPIANTYLLSFNQAVGINLWSLERYLDYTLFLILANGVAFELGAVGIFVVRLGLVSAETLIAKRRLAIVGAFVLAALLTPPDVLTQLLLAFPLIGLYEALIIYARVQASAAAKKSRFLNT